jgi:hypothetical protein
MSLPTLLDLDDDLSTPRRKFSVMHQHVSENVVEKETEPQLMKPVITPVLRIRAIEASELSSNSSEENFPLSSRRSSKVNSSARRGTLRSTVTIHTFRRLTLAVEPHQSLMTEYTQKTAEMLADTQFRVRGFKAQRAIPQRYFKNLAS